jgi:hypothetical protein
MIGRWQSLRTQFSRPVALLYVAQGVLHRLSGGRAQIVPYALVAQPLHSQALAQVRDDPRSSVGAITEEAEVVQEFPRPPEVIAHRFATGATCHVALVKDRFAGFIWFRRDGYMEDEVRCHFRLSDPARSVWDFDVYVAPEFRLGRTMARMWKSVGAVLRQDGAEWSISRISLFNAGSLSSHARLGARRIGTAVFLVLGRFQLGGFSHAPYLHASFSDTSVPELLIAAPAAVEHEASGGGSPTDGSIPRPAPGSVRPPE